MRENDKLGSAPVIRRAQGMATRLCGQWGEVNPSPFSRVTNAFAAWPNGVPHGCASWQAPASSAERLLGNKVRRKTGSRWEAGRRPRSLAGPAGEVPREQGAGVARNTEIPEAFVK